MSDFINQKFTNRYYDLNWREILIYFSFILICCRVFISWFNNDLDSSIRYTITIPIFLSFNIKKWNKFKIFLILFFLISLLARRLLVIWSMVALGYLIIENKISLRNLALIGIIVVFIELIILFELNAFSIVQNQGYLYLKSNKILYDLGTGNTNRTGLIFIFLIFYLYIVLYSKAKFSFLIISSIIVFITFEITGCRTLLYSVIILEILAIGYFNNLFKSWMKWPIATIPIIAFCGTFYLAANILDNTDINSAASGRLNFIIKFTQEYTTKEWLVGAPTELDEPLDSSYATLITKGGIFLASFLCLSFIITVCKDFKLIKPLLPVLIAILIAGALESFLANLNGITVIFWTICVQAYLKEKLII